MSDLQWENKWRRESQTIKCRSHSILQKAANFPLCLSFHQSIQSLQTVCTYSPLWVSNCPLGLGFYLQLQSFTPLWTEVSFGMAFSCIVLQQSCGGTTLQTQDHTFNSYQFEYYSFKNIYIYLPAGHINLMGFNNYQIFIKQVMRSRNKK